MKRTLLSISAALCIVGAWANPVSPGAAKAKARQIMKAEYAGLDTGRATVKAVGHEGRTAYYVVQFANGWTLVSADDTTEPLIAFAPTGTYHTEGQPESVRAMMQCYARRIADRASRLTSVADGWAAESATRPMMYASPTRASKDDVEPLITVNWNQDGSFKKYCPKDNNGQAIVGCVAVGMAQAMSVAQWPKRPSGQYGYTDPTYGYQYIDYDKEPAYNWADILSGANSNDDVARLLWHCGVAVNMQYGLSSSGGSGTLDSYIATALPRNFGYSASTVKYVRRSGKTDAEWESLVYGELSAGRAVCLSGQDLQNGYGHCFNLDGYKNGAYHVNWGWGGANNGYFVLNALKDATMGMDYSAPAYQSLIVGIQKPADAPAAEGPQDITLSATNVAADAPVGTVVADVAVVFETTPAPAYTLSVTGTKYNPVTHRYNTVPFKVEGSQLVTTDAMPQDKSSVDIRLRATDANGKSMDKTFTIGITTSVGIDGIRADDVQAVDYYDMQGRHASAAQRGATIAVYTMRDGRQRIVKIVK